MSVMSGRRSWVCSRMWFRSYSQLSEIVRETRFDVSRGTEVERALRRALIRRAQSARSTFCLGRQKHFRTNGHVAIRERSWHWVNRRHPRLVSRIIIVETRRCKRCLVHRSDPWCRLERNDTERWDPEEQVVSSNSLGPSTKPAGFPWPW